MHYLIFILLLLLPPSSCTRFNDLADEERRFSYMFPVFVHAHDVLLLRMYSAVSLPALLSPEPNSLFKYKINGGVKAHFLGPRGTLCGGKLV